ncbi:MAG: hypothetical protein HZY75_13035 [Nocardioidaceae bacterium]|nr:MAG: hypothetical protein HZY75_13035 [Nocardioidaceae bacterium]
MVGKHARERRFADRGLKLAWFGLRELLVVVVIGVALPGAILVLLPRLRDQVDTLDVGAFLLAAAWPALACVIMWALGWRHPARLASPTIALLGAVTASPRRTPACRKAGTSRWHVQV